MDETKSYQCYEEQEANEDFWKVVSWLVVIVIVALLIGFASGRASADELDDAFDRYVDAQKPFCVKGWQLSGSAFIPTRCPKRRA